MQAFIIPDPFDLTDLQSYLEETKPVPDIQELLEKKIKEMIKEFDEASMKGFRAVMRLYTTRRISEDDFICCDWCKTRYERVERVYPCGLTRFGWKGCCGRIVEYLDGGFTLSFGYGSKYDGGAIKIEPIKGRGRLKLLRIDDCICDQCYQEDFPAIKIVNKIKSEIRKEIK